MSPSSKNLPHRSGFALSELVALLVVAAVLAAILLPMADAARRNSRLSEDLSNLRRIGTLTRSYAADFDDKMWAFSWLPGNYTTHWPDLMSLTNDPYATAARQAVAIMRDRGSLTMQQAPMITGWFPHTSFQHLVLQDYAADSLPNQMFISAGDRPRLRWSADPHGFRVGALPPQPNPSQSGYRWIYSSSYELPPAFYDQGTGFNRLRQGGATNIYTLPPAHNSNFAGVSLSIVAHPSGKAMLYDLHSRHFGTRQPVFLLPEARIPVLFADGAASLRQSEDSNLGVDPTANQATTSPYTSVYQAQPWEPASVSGFQDVGDLRYRWTRMRILGRDFGGPPVYP